MADGIKDITEDKETWKSITRPASHDNHDASDYSDTFITDHYNTDMHHDVAVIEGLG